MSIPPKFGKESFLKFDFYYPLIYPYLFLPTILATLILDKYRVKLPNIPCKSGPALRALDTDAPVTYEICH
jgi:hypothetical protein